MHSLSPATSTDECILQGDTPGLNLLPRRRKLLYAGTRKKAFFSGLSGSSTRKFGVQTAWNIDEDVRRALATHHSHSAFEFSSSEEEDEDDDLTSPCRSSSIDHAVKDTISEAQAHPEIKPAPHHKRSPSEHSDDESPLVAMEAKSTHFDEKGGLRLENDNTWEMISI